MVALAIVFLGAGLKPDVQQSAAVKQEYSISDLGTLGSPLSTAATGQYISKAYAINSKGQIVGEAFVDRPNSPQESSAIHAFLWSDGDMHDLGALPFSDIEAHESKAFALNDHGQVVGGSGGYEVMEHEMGGLLSATPFFYTRGRMQPLLKLAKDTVELGEAFGINDSGQVVGVKGGGAFLWEKGRITFLKTLQKHSPPSRDAGNRALGINNKGQVVGTATVDPGTAAHPFLWRRAGGMEDLGVPPGTTSGDANAISDGGDIVGIAYGQTPGGVAWRWHRGRLRVLPGLPGAHDNSADALNDRNQTVGRSGHRATLWNGDQPVELGRLIRSPDDWRLQEATGINARGQIVGYGIHNGKTRAFLLTPRPLPATGHHP